MSARKVYVPKRFLLWRAAPLAGYLLLLSVLAVALLQLEHQGDRLCDKQVQNRQAVRQVYSDVAALGRSLLDNPELDPERRAVLDSRFRQFEQDRLLEFPPIAPGCEGVR